MTANELKRSFTLRDLQAYNSKLANENKYLNFQYKELNKNFEVRVNYAVKERTKELEKNYKKQLKEKNKELLEKDKQIEALKEKIAKMQSKMDNDSTNSGLSTAKTAIGKQKYIPNCREKTDKKIGGQEGHTKHKLKPFSEDEITEEVEVTPTECNKCHSKDIEILETSIDKQELDYEVKVIKRKNRFKNCRCRKCGNEFHAPIPNDLKEDIQYGKTVQSLAVCLTNEIYTPFNKTVKLVSGITNGEINMSEGYVTKLQKRASSFLEKFASDLNTYIPQQEVIGWDDGVVKINTKDGIIRVYVAEKVILLVGHENKNETGLDEDGILLNCGEDTVVMHDHILHNYNDKYNFKNVECMIHLIRRLKKKLQETNHKWCEDFIKFLSKTNKDRNNLLKQDKDSFDKNYLMELDETYDKFIVQAYKENDEDTNNYFFDKELNFINDLKKYKKNYLMWAYDFRLPSTNNDCERGIRPIKSKMKISGQFQNLKYLQYYANIRSYIETCKKNGINIIEACVRLMNGNPYTLEDILKIGKENEESKKSE